VTRAFIRAGDRTRTGDPHLGKVMLYQLSHARRAAHYRWPSRAKPSRKEAQPGESDSRKANATDPQEPPHEYVEGKMRKLISILLAGGLVVGAVASASAAAKPKPVTVFTDAEGDAGNDTAGPLPGAAEAGFDLVSGTIAKAGANLDFTVTQAAMPASGTLGEGFRLLWHFNVGSTEYRFTVKSLDIGKPDVVAQSGTERVGQVYQGVARLETCTLDTTLPLTLSQCVVLGYYDATFDSASASEKWSVPLKDMKAKTGSLINPGTGGAAGTGCQICWVPHYAERSLTPTSIIDAAAMAVSYKVPK
jgi:hypothetical protein